MAYLEIRGLCSNNNGKRGKMQITCLEIRGLYSNDNGKIGKMQMTIFRYVICALIIMVK